MTSTMEAAAAAGGMTYARFFPSDWRTGCLGLNLEEEGLYIRICAYMYDTGKALKDDYAECSLLLRVHPNKLRKVLDSLIDKGKIIRAQGILINERVVEEIDRYRRDYATRVIAAKKREEVRRLRTAQQIEEARALVAKEEATPHSTPQSTPHPTPPVQMGVPTPDTRVVNFENINKNNDARPQPRQSSTTNPESIIQKPELLLHGEEPEGGGGHLESLNGTAVDLVAFIAKHAHVNQADARRMLETNVKTFSADAMMEAYSVTLANMGAQFISAPYKYLIETARRMKTNTKANAGKPGNDVASRRERIRKHAEEAAAEYDRGRRVQ